MSKLDEIEAYFSTVVNSARYPELEGQYIDWLIARSRTLGLALGEAIEVMEASGDITGHDAEYDAGTIQPFCDVLKGMLKEKEIRRNAG